MNIVFGNTLCKVLISLTLILAPYALASDGVEDNLARLMTTQLPDRAVMVPGGRAFLDELASLTIAKREEAILDALGKGFFPDFLRSMKPVTVTENGHTLTFWVMPDY